MVVSQTQPRKYFYALETIFKAISLLFIFKANQALMILQAATRSFKKMVTLKHKFSLFTSGKSMIRLAVAISSQQEYANPKIKEASPYISNSQDFFDPAQSTNTKIVSTRFEVDLNKENFQLQLSKLIDKRSIYQITENKQMATATPSLSRLIGITPVVQNELTSKSEGDPYFYARKNIVECEKYLQENVGPHVAWMLDKDNFIKAHESDLFKKRYKSIDFNILQYYNNQKSMMDYIHQKSFKLQHIFLRSYVVEDGRFVEHLDFTKNQVNLNELFQILRLNYFRGVLVLPFTSEYFLPNLVHIKSLLHGSGLYIQKSDAEINDNWRVL